MSLRKPYDERLIKCMVNAAKGVFESGLRPVLAYVFSDEVNYIFIGDLAFKGGIEKLDSIVASLLSRPLHLK